ncbi:chemotaxis protein CheA [Thalassobaculum litoreum]|uniref:Chemotaxis protein CheA n=1 Tax=Thalassobaculum litoreum DSM 18839 TaxID=1123362 RepID=A0A8G2BGS1_9PROT|nr:Hpt domain-containing protein [Thalassobaculum litoreum]SDF61932.1 Chemotaxis protein histidine kinase CheA [Thalassobaculum litoreum DSM 18839]
MSGFDDNSEMWELFEQESEDYLAQLEANLSGSTADLENPDIMGALFRAIHSLKGVSASLGLTGMETVAHAAEDLLDMFRNGEARPNEASRELLLQSADALVDLREACLESRSDVAGDAGLIAALKQAKAQLKSGGEVTAAAQPDPAVAEAPPAYDPPEPEPEPEEETAAATQSRMAIQVSQKPANDDEAEFQPGTVQPFNAVVTAELGQLAEALENPAMDSLDSQAIVSSMLAIREAANDVGYLGIAGVLGDILGVLEGDQSGDRTALIRALCIFIHRLRVLSELADAGIAMDDVDDSMAPHISREARAVVDRLSIRGGASADWELVGILARALGVFRISALARLASELTLMEAWTERSGALEVADEIRRESEVIGIEGLTVSSLDMPRETYDRLRDELALLLTGAGAAVAELRKVLGDDLFDSMSPAARNEAVEFLEQPGARLVQVQVMVPDGAPASGEILGLLYRQQVISNRVLVDIDPDLYQFLIGVTGDDAPVEASVRTLDTSGDVLRAWTVLVIGDKAATASAPAAPAAPPPAAEAPTPPAAETDGHVLFVDDSSWDSALQSGWSPEQQEGFAAPFGDSPASPPQPAPKPAPAQPHAATPPQSDPPPSASSRAPDTAPAAPPARPAERPAEPPATAADGSVPAERGEASPSRSTGAGVPGSAGGSSLRVSSALIDSYLDTVAELRLSLSRLDQGASEAGFGATAAELRSLAGQIDDRKAERLYAAAARIDDAGKVFANQIARAEVTLRMLHSVTLDLRVVPISIVFGRMPRLVRDLARSLGKQVTLEIDDGDIQIDKSMVDALMEPMVHMIRNAMDHGIEGPQERLDAGKPEKATLTLRATQHGNVAQIMIAEDGRGLNTNRIRNKALEKGLITEQDAARMTEREIHRQIFAPGFSTAAAVTETSGRGVGMDVVLTTLRRLGGAIDIDSEDGEGTRFYLSFPVSAALQRIVVVSDGTRDLGLPERAIIEVIEVDRKQIQTVGERAGIQHRDGFLTVRAIETMLGWETPEVAVDQQAFPVVIIGTPQRRIGVAVHRVKRRQEVFMKELHPALNSVDVLAGATVMGEGQPLLVLDPETLIAIAGG